VFWKEGNSPSHGVDARNDFLKGGRG